MKIGVISDTHLTGCDGTLKASLANHFDDVDWVVHAGDLVDLAVLDLFAPKKVFAVHGNCDPGRVRSLLPGQRTLDVGGFRLLVVHDAGSVGGGAGEPQNPVASCDCLVFGHTHRPVNRTAAGVLYFNPGSATHNRCSPVATVGILEIGTEIRGEIIELRKNG